MKMQLYQNEIERVSELCEKGRFYPYRESEISAQGDSGSIILTKETAYELGGSGLPAINSALFRSSDTEDHDRDGVVLCGRDLTQIDCDTPYARIAVITLRDDLPTDEEEMYRQLKDIELIKYRVFVRDCLIRLSPATKREQIKVSKKAVENRLSLINIGYRFIHEYKKAALVKAVKIYFVTDKDFAYKKLSDICERAAGITSSLNKIMKGLKISCQSCELKEICDEVEGLRELHFGKGSNENNE